MPPNAAHSQHMTHLVLSYIPKQLATTTTNGQQQQLTTLMCGLHICEQKLLHHTFNGAAPWAFCSSAIATDAF